MTDRQFAALIRSRPVDVVRLALEQVRTVDGALRMYRAELAGLKRLTLLWTAERRIAQLRGSEWPGVRTALIAEGHAIEPGRA